MIHVIVVRVQMGDAALLCGAHLDILLNAFVFLGRTAGAIASKVIAFLDVHG